MTHGLPFREKEAREDWHCRDIRQRVVPTLGTVNLAVGDHTRPLGHRYYRMPPDTFGAQEKTGVLANELSFARTASCREQRCTGNLAQPVGTSGIRAILRGVE
jgi:hypothetical protein